VRVFNELAKIDFVVTIDGRDVAVQTDHREAEQIEADWESSVLFAAARVRNPLRSGRCAAVRYAAMQGPPARFARLLTALGATVEVTPGETLHEAAPDTALAEAEVNAAIERLGERVLAEHGSLEAAEKEIAAGLDRESEAETWGAVVALGAATVVSIRRKYPARLVADEEIHCMIPYRFAVGNSVINVFGRTERFLNEDPSELPSRLLAVLDDQQAPDGEVMFQFRPHDFAGRELALHVPFLANTDKVDPRMPILGIVVDRPSSVKSMSPDTPADDIARYRAEAGRNITSVEVQVDEISVAQVRAVAVSGHYYASEKLFDRDFMRTLHARLGATMLAAAVPRKGRLWVHDGVVDPEVLGAFLAIVTGEYDKAPPSERLGTTLFAVVDGEVVGVARITGKDGQPIEHEAPRKKGFWSRLFGG